jgi:hypothetical protein
LTREPARKIKESDSAIITVKITVFLKNIYHTLKKKINPLFPAFLKIRISTQRKIGVSTYRETG